MRINPIVYGLLALTVFMGTIGAAQLGGMWSVSGKVTGTGEKVAPTGQNVDEIKGWMTLADVSKAYNVPVEEIAAAFDLPADTTPSTQIKNLESETFSVTNLRTWLQSRPAGP